jgi:hypothetical protein
MHTQVEISPSGKPKPLMVLANSHFPKILASLNEMKAEIRQIVATMDFIVKTVALSEVVFDEATCEWGIAPDCLTVRVPAGLVAKAGHVPPNGGTTSEEKASIPVSRRAHVLHASRPAIIRAATTRARRDVDVAPAKFFAASTDRNLHLLPTALIMPRRELH